MMATGSSYLINEPPLLVLPSLAAKVGINQAIFLQQLHYWLRTSKHIHGGHRWVYNTYGEWQEQMPWLTVRGVRKIVADLEAGGYIVCGSFNRLSFDKTKWYRIDYDALKSPEPPMCHEVTDGVTETSDDAPETADDVSFCDASGVSQSDTPIPETTETTTEESAQKRTRPTQVPDDFPITEAIKTWGEKNGFTVRQMEGQVESFQDHYRSKGEARKDWTASFRTWMKRARKFGDVEPAAPKRNGPPADDPRYYGTQGLARWREEQAQGGGA